MNESPPVNNSSAPPPANNNLLPRKVLSAREPILNNATGQTDILIKIGDFPNFENWFAMSDEPSVDPVSDDPDRLFPDFDDASVDLVLSGQTQDRKTPVICAEDFETFLALDAEHDMPFIQADEAAQKRWVEKRRDSIFTAHIQGVLWLFKYHLHTYATLRWDEAGLQILRGVWGDLVNTLAADDRLFAGENPAQYAAYFCHGVQRAVEALEWEARQKGEAGHSWRPHINEWGLREMYEALDTAEPLSEEFATFIALDDKHDMAFVYGNMHERQAWIEQGKQSILSAYMAGMLWFLRRYPEQGILLQNDAGTREKLYAIWQTIGPTLSQQDQLFSQHNPEEYAGYFCQGVFLAMAFLQPAWPETGESLPAVSSEDTRMPVLSSEADETPSLRTDTLSLENPLPDPSTAYSGDSRPQLARVFSWFPALLETWVYWLWHWLTHGTSVSRETAPEIEASGHSSVAPAAMQTATAPAAIMFFAQEIPPLSQVSVPGSFRIPPSPAVRRADSGVSPVVLRSSKPLVIYPDVSRFAILPRLDLAGLVIGRHIMLALNIVAAELQELYLAGSRFTGWQTAFVQKLETGQFGNLQIVDLRQTNLAASVLLRILRAVENDKLPRLKMLAMDFPSVPVRQLYERLLLRDQYKVISAAEYSPKHSNVSDRLTIQLNFQHERYTPEIILRILLHYLNPGLLQSIVDMQMAGRKLDRQIMGLLSMFPALKTLNIEDSYCGSCRAYATFAQLTGQGAWGGVNMQTAGSVFAKAL